MRRKGLADESGVMAGDAGLQGFLDFENWRILS